MRKDQGDSNVLVKKSLFLVWIRICQIMFHHILVIQIIKQILQNSSSRPGSFNSMSLYMTTKYFANIDGTANRVTPHSMDQMQWTSDHEKASTKMFVLAKHIVDEHQTQHLIISSPDTDVFVVGCYHFISNLITIDKLWLKIGTGSKKRYVAIHETTNHFRRSMLKS